MVMLLAGTLSMSSIRKCRTLRGSKDRESSCESRCRSSAWVRESKVLLRRERRVPDLEGESWIEGWRKGIR
jgi:hypothetical protein